MAAREHFDFILGSPLKIAKQGEEVEAVALQVYSPAPNCILALEDLEQEYTVAQINTGNLMAGMVRKDSDKDKSAADTLQEIGQEHADKAEDEKEPSLDEKGESVIAILTMGKADMRKCYDALFKVLMQNSAARKSCTVEDDVALNKTMWEEIEIADKRRLLGQYVAFFTSAFRAS